MYVFTDEGMINEDRYRWKDVVDATGLKCYDDQRQAMGRDCRHNSAGELKNVITSSGIHVVKKRPFVDNKD